MITIYGCKIVNTGSYGTIVGAKSGLPPLPEKYRMRWRWGFWKVQRGGPYMTWDDTFGWETIKSYPHKAEATAHLVRLALEGKQVQL